jgi:GNAT superfamily N-acetyltransferase
MKPIVVPVGFIWEMIRKDHPRSQFHSGLAEVDDWLRTKALQSHQKRLSSTKLLLDSRGQIAGFYSLTSTPIDFSDLPPELTRRLPERPHIVALIAWLGVDLQYQGQRLGSHLLAHALQDCYLSGNSIPFIAIIVDALTEKAKQFYASWGFEELPGFPRRLIMSYSKLQTIVESH